MTGSGKDTEQGGFIRCRECLFLNCGESLEKTVSMGCRQRPCCWGCRTLPETESTQKKRRRETDRDTESRGHCASTGAPSHPKAEATPALLRGAAQEVRLVRKPVSVTWNQKSPLRLLSGFVARNDSTTLGFYEWLLRFLDFDALFLMAQLPSHPPGAPSV